MQEKIKNIIAEQLTIKPERIFPSDNFVDDLNADSLDLMELVMALEEELEIELPDDTAQKITTVAELYTFVEKEIG